MNLKKLLIIVGTRPNFVKVTQFKKTIAEQFSSSFELKILHTGQHYDQQMSQVFFQQFDLLPDHFLEIKSKTALGQMAQIMLGLENILFDYQPDWVLVVGDVNSTFAAAFAAHKNNFKVAHVESGLRSLDRKMPEEINRILTDEITDLFFATEQSGIENLIAEGKDKSKIHFVGNTMIDTMVAFENKIQASNILEKIQLKEKDFALMTIHRPRNVDHIEGLEKLLGLIKMLTKSMKLVFPIHHRTKNNLIKNGLFEPLEQNSNLILTEPLDYFAFQKLIASCQFILTDSGGIQEEATFRKIPCLTLRPNTERPSTITIGSNKLLPFDNELIKKEIQNIQEKKSKKGEIPPFWDGKATNRILEVLNKI